MNLEYIYGLNPAFEVVRARRRAVRAAYLTSGGETGARRRKLAELLKKASIPVLGADRRKLFDLCKTSEHQGIVLEAETYPYIPLETMRSASRLLLVDNVEDPQNVGAILRSAEIFGWHDVLLSNRGVPQVYPSVVKASAGATEHLRISREFTANEYVKRLMAQEFTLVALDSRGADIRDLGKLKLEKMLLVIGGEHRGVGQHILNQAQHVAGIVQRGHITSLNASVAAGIALFVLGAQEPRMKNCPPNGAR